MKLRTLNSLAALGCVFLMGCSGGSKAEKTDDAATETTTEAAVTESAESAPAEKPELAPCTDLANVPAGATNCLLDLGQAKDTYWNDSDGVDPATAGCHYEFSDDTCGENLPERTFGELCLDADRLVESNPGKDECHTHGNDMGKPGVVSCSAWCAEQGQGGGACVGGIEASGTHGSCTSARCECG